MVDPEQFDGIQIQIYVDRERKKISSKNLFFQIFNKKTCCYVEELPIFVRLGYPIVILRNCLFLCG